MCLHLTGTQYFQPLDDEALQAAGDLWNQELVSENNEVYRGEYLAVDLFETAELPSDPAVIDAAWVQGQIGGRFDEGYAKGVHDHDAAAILRALVHNRGSQHRFAASSANRAGGVTAMVPTNACHAKTRKAMTDWIGGFAKLAKAYPEAQPAVEFRNRLAELAEQDQEIWQPVFGRDVTAERVAAYLFDQLTATPKKAVCSGKAAQLFEEFLARSRNRIVTSCLDAGDQGNRLRPGSMLTSWPATGRRHLLPRTTGSRRGRSGRLLRRRASLA